VHTNDIHAEFLANVGVFQNLVTHRNESLEASKLIPAVDMVFIDGSHSFEDVTSDIEAWGPLARKLICGHDYQFPPVLIAVHQRFARVENPVGSIWVGVEKRP
jgi:Methyltransferase domain